MSDKITHIGQLKPDQRNPRRHNQRNIGVVVDSLQQVGFARSIVIDEDGTILAGNGVTEAAGIAGIEKVIEVEADGETIVAVRRRGLTEEQKTKLKYYDNRSGELADWDASVIVSDLELGLDLSSLWNPLEMSELLEAAGSELLGSNGNEKETPEPEIDRAKELAEEYGTESGQIWKLGEHHRIACIDSTDKEAVKKFLGRIRYMAMVTDPPYGVNYEGGRNPVSNVPREKLQGDTDPTLYDRFLKVWREYRESKGVLYIWFASSVGKPVYEAIEGNGFDIRALIIWNKLDAHYGNFMAQYMQKHEPCLYCVKDGTNWYGPTNEVTVWDIKQPNINEYHPTEKPLECMVRPITNSTKKGDVVVDPFLGSGTTLIACEQLGRVCYGVEIDPGYTAVSIKRWETLTGEKAALIG